MNIKNISDFTDDIFVNEFKIKNISNKIGIPYYLLFFIILIEDKRFFSHFGFDLIGILRAFLVNKKNKRRKQGASTIPQQIYDINREKNKLKRERTYKRKLKQILYSLKIESKNNKAEILKYYIENVYFGRNFYGVSEAAKGYFNKEAKLLNKVELFFLVERIASPNKKLNSRVRGILNRNKIKQSFTKNELKRLEELYKSFEEGELWQRNNIK